jgi:CubicO group peptidase (beta-lactamase class C family)
MISGNRRWALTTGALAIVTIASASPALAQSKEPYPGLDAYITKAVQTWKIPGISVAIVRNDSVLYTKGFGVLSAANSKPVDDQTLFEIGSSSKAFTATLVAMLVTDGKMRWDDHLTNYLPGFKMYDAEANEEVTLRDALTHRSGIARGELAWLGSGVSRDQVLHRVRFLKPESPFRSRYSYQNMMFLAAGEAAAKAAGSSWEDLVKQRIFVPLGMTNSVTSSHGLATPDVAQPHGMDHDTAFIKPPFNAENIAPAGAILSSARDMAQWLRFQLNDGQVNGKRLVSTQALKETHSPQILTSPGAGGGRGGGGDTIPATRFTSYGMGWFVEDYHQQLRWQHGGNTLGMTAAVGMLPEKRLGVAVLSNMQGAALPGIIMDYVMDRELGLPMKDLSNDAYTRALTQRRRADSVEKMNAAQHPADAKPPLPLTAYTGVFADSLYGDANVVVKDGHLELERGEWHGPLQYWNANNFRWTILPGAPTGPMFIKFEVSPDNVVTGLWFGLAGDVSLLNRKGGAGGGRGRGGRP